MSENIERNRRLLALMERWVKFTGVALDQSSFLVRLGGDAPNEIDVSQNYKRVQQAIEMDPSGILPVACFRSFFNHYVKHMSVSAADMLDAAEFQKSMAQLSELQAIKKELDDPIFVEPVKSLQENIQQAASHYGCNVEAVKKVAGDEGALEDAMFMAFKGTENMPEDWFAKGQYDVEPPQLCKTILTFQNDLQAISFAAQMPKPFIALGVVYDKFNPIFSHFMFLCKSGENVWMLHDRTEWEHPAQEELVSSRRGGERFFEHHKEFAWQFPYDIIGQFEKKGDSVISNVPLASLGPETVAWLIMVFERIRLKYFEGKYEPKKLMAVISEEPIVFQTALTTDAKALAAAEGIKLLGDGQAAPQVVTISLQVGTPKPVTREEVKQDAIAKDFEGSSGKHRWLEERYEDQIPESAFNPLQLADSQGRKLLPEGGGSLSDQQKDWQVRMGNVDAKFPVMTKCIPVKADREAFEHVRSDIRAVTHQAVGDIAKFEKDARWHARFNKANMVQYLAWEEYYRRKDEVMAWFRKTALKNRDHIAQWAARGELVAESISGGGMIVCGRGTGKRTGDIKTENIVRRPLYCKRGWPHYNHYHTCGTAWIVREPGFHGCKCFCPVTGAAATIFVGCFLHTAEAIAVALGIEVNELPDVLRRYSRKEVYTGNHLLCNIDPMDWCVEDPWAAQGLGIMVGFSRRGYARLRKEMGLEPVLVESMEDGDD